MRLPDDPPFYEITPMEYRARLAAGWIDAYWQAHGRAPSVREVGMYVGLSSSFTSLQMLRQMREHGLVRWQDGRVGTLEALTGPALGSVRRRQCDPGPERHGKPATYQHWGCRCESCRAAHSVYRKDHQRRKREQAASIMTTTEQHIRRIA